MTEYHKLVRDNIPEIIIANGKIPITRVLSDSEYELALIDKVVEEARELAQADTTEEMEGEIIDLEEVLDALKNFVSSKEHLEEARTKKAKERGGFGKRIFLERVED